MQGRLPTYYKSQRLRHGLSQKQLAKILARDHRQISSLENEAVNDNLFYPLAYSLLFDEPISGLVPRYFSEIKELLIQGVDSNSNLLKQKGILEQIKDNLAADTINTSQMTSKSTNTPSTLSIFPSGRGFSYCFFESPTKLISWANVIAKDSEYESKTADLIEKYQPDNLVTEEHECRSFPRRFHFKSKLQRLYDVAEQYPNTNLKRYPRLFVSGVFEIFKAGTHFEIYELISEWLPELKKYKPRKQKLWEGKHPRSYLFHAVSFAIAHYYVSN